MKNKSEPTKLVSIQQTPNDGIDVVLSLPRRARSLAKQTAAELGTSQEKFLQYFFESSIEGLVESFDEAWIGWDFPSKAEAEAYLARTEQAPEYYRFFVGEDGTCNIAQKSLREMSGAASA